MSWQREYATVRSATKAIFFAVVLGFIGLIFMVLFSPLAGGALFVAAIGLPFLISYFSTNVHVSCDQNGFRVVTESKRSGKTDVVYGWHEITATRYWESASRSSDRTRAFAYFAVDTVRGTAFTLPRESKGFQDLIEVFNIMWSQLPYVWKPRTGFNISFGPVTASRWAYVQVPRDQASQA